MASEITALARAIARAAESRFQSLGVERGMPMPGVLVQRPPNMFDSFSHQVGEADSFATGYDSGSGTTTMAFTTDLSIFDGDDILTG